MIKLINDLFESYGYGSDDILDGFLFSSRDKEASSDFWLVIQFDDLKLVLDHQSKLFDLCKKLIPDPSLDKNISMLVLWDTSGALELSKMKKTVMSVEEDTYFFKKNVLYYSDQELDSLKKIMGEASLHDFLQTQLATQAVFSKYKENPLSQGWQPLLYRIAIKVPFIDIHIGPSGGLDSLFEKNIERVNGCGDKELVKLEEDFFELGDADISAMEYLAALLPVLKGAGNGD